MENKYAIEVNGNTGKIAVVRSWTGSLKLYYRDECVPRTDRKGPAARYRIVTDAGQKEELLLRQDTTDVPTSIFRGRKYPLGRPLLWWEWLLCLIPLLAAMLFAVFHGAIGLWCMMACATFASLLAS